MKIDTRTLPITTLLIAASAFAQPVPEPGDLLISAIDAITGLPDIFAITPEGLVGETGLLPSELPTLVELTPATMIDQGALEVTVLDNGSGMLRFNYFGGGSNEGGPIYTSLIDPALGLDSFDIPIVGFDNPIVAFDNPIVGFRAGILGLAHPFRANMPDFFEDPLFGFEDPLFGFEDPLFGFEDPLFGFTTNSVIVSYSGLVEEHELTITGGTVSAGLAYPRDWFIDPDEINQFDGVAGESLRNYAGFAVYSEDAPQGAGVYLAPLTRSAIENATLELLPLATGAAFNTFAIDGMHIDPVIPGHAFIWGTNGTARGATAPVPTIMRVQPDGAVSTLTTGGSLTQIDDLIVTPTTIYALDASSPSGTIVSIDPTTGAQSVLTTGGSVFHSPSSISIVQTRSPRIDIDTTTDSPDPTPGDGFYGPLGSMTSLRAAIEEANAQSTPHTIVLPSGTYSIGSNGELDIETHITLVGSGADTTIISGDNTSRIFTVYDGASLKLKGITLDEARANSGNGGAIQAQGHVALEDVVISNAFVNANGGAIHTNAPLNVLRSHFVGNQANDDGGAISTMNSTLIIDRASFFENEALNGGALAINNSNADILNTTFYLNLSFWEGGAIRSISTEPVRLLHCTVLENEAGVFPNDDSAGGFDATGSTALPIIKSSVFSDNSFDGDTADVFGSFALADHSRFSTMNGATFGSLVAVMPSDSTQFLGIPVQIGVTQTFAPHPSSIIIDSGATDEFPSFDQLGHLRVIDGDNDLTPIPDIGAYESPDPCPADLNDDGSLDFFDVSALITQQIDYNADTSFDFFDISSFLQDLSAGCP